MEWLVLLALGWMFWRVVFKREKYCPKKAAQNVLAASDYMDEEEEIVSRIKDGSSPVFTRNKDGSWAVKYEESPEPEKAVTALDKQAASGTVKTVKKEQNVPEMDIDISPEYKKAFSAIDDGENILILGPAGTGKSTFLSLLKSEYDDKNIVIVAPTGVAALNAGGQTIHSFFKLKPQIVRQEDIKVQRTRNAYKKLDMLVIDEISMVRADVFDAIDRFLRLNGKNGSEPFGGVQIILIGDLYQLPPVVSGGERDAFHALYDSPFFFGAKAYQDGNFKRIEFKKIYRQKDRKFVGLLNNIRIGNLDGDVLEKINARHVANFDSGNIASLDPIILTGRNVRAEYINETRLNELPGKVYSFHGEITGKFNIAEDKLPAPMDLTLKKGARVMFTKNDGARNWVNGTMGIVENVSEDEILVKVGSREYEVPRAVWETVRYVYDDASERWEPETVGKYEQYPLMLAWAVTVHKSQGKTLESCLVDLDTGAFADGQVYVALSRCKTFENLFLENPLNASDIRVSREVAEFMG